MSLTPKQILEHKYSVRLRAEHSKTKSVGSWLKTEMSQEAKDWLENIDEADYLVVSRDSTSEVLFKDEVRATMFKLAFG